MQPRHQTTTTEPMVRVTQRKRKVGDNDTVFIPYYNHAIASVVEDRRIELLDIFPTSWVKFEPNLITLENGRKVHQRYILWVSEEELIRYHHRIRHERESWTIQAKLNEYETPDIPPTATVRSTPRPIPAPAPIPPKKPIAPAPLPPYVVDGHGRRWYFEELTAEPPKKQEPIIAIEHPIPDPQPPPATVKVRRVGISKKTKHKGIYRHNDPDRVLTGYYASVRWKGKQYDKFFGDSACGGRLAAIDAAIEWRNQTEKEIGKPRTEKRVVGITRPTNTGHPGVTRITRRSGNEVFSVAWRDADGTQRRTSYSIAKHGERRAFSLAKKRYREGVKERLNSAKGRTS